jgi:hypothetical protein
MEIRATLPRRVWTIGVVSVIVSGFAGCEFRRPNEGYDPDWRPDREERLKDPSGTADDATTGSAEPDDRIHAHEGIRPGDIASDTGELASTSHTWSERDGAFESDCRVYRKGDTVVMIVERTDRLTRSYFFDDGALFYFTESDARDNTETVVEFDEIGDIRGSQKMRGDLKVTISDDELSDIVEHASEILAASSTD